MTDCCDLAYLACDDCGEWMDTGEVKTKDGRRVAKARGWTTYRNEYGSIQDRCPKCTENAKKAKS